jgi:mono/diheme cytochrome c family protein
MPRSSKASARGRLLALSLLAAGVTAPVQAQGNRAIRPAGVTDSSIAWGESLFRGSANCSRCHGERGRGGEYGPDLADAVWWHGPGTFEWLVREVTHGIPENLTVTGGVMPPRGWAPMHEGDVRAVAAYVWAISHPPKPPPPEPPRPN